MIRSGILSLLVSLLLVSTEAFGVAPQNFGASESGETSMIN